MTETEEVQTAERKPDKVCTSGLIFFHCKLNVVTEAPRFLQLGAAFTLLRHKKLLNKQDATKMEEKKLETRQFPVVLLCIQTTGDCYFK